MDNNHGNTNKNNVTILNQIGQFIRERRLALGLTQEQLAESAGLQPNYVTSIETGRKNISLTTLERVLLALNTNLLEILTDSTINPIHNKTLNSHIKLLSLRSDDDIVAIHRISKEVIRAIDNNRE